MTKFLEPWSHTLQVNEYCLNKVCVPAKKEGQICRGRYECEFGLQCYAKGPLFSKFKCHPPHQVGDDDEFDTSFMTNGYDSFLGYDSVCESHYSVKHEGRAENHLQITQQEGSVEKETLVRTRIPKIFGERMEQEGSAVITPTTIHRPLGVLLRSRITQSVGLIEAQQLGISSN